MLRLTPSSSSLASYRLVAGWVLADAIWRYKRRIAVLVAMGGLGVFMQGGALGAALLYARSLESGDPVDLLGQQLDPRSDVELLALVAAVLTGALVLGGYFLYRFKSGAISLGREYETLRIRETLAAAERLPHPGVSGATDLLDEGHVFQVQRDARFCGRVLRKTVEGFVPVIVVPAAGLILLVLSPALTLVLAGLTSAVAVIMFRINRRGARASERMERLARDATRERKDAVRGLLSGDVSSQENGQAPSLAHTGNVKRHLDAYTDRLQAIEDSGLASSLVTAIALGAILLVQGRAVLAGQSSISALLAYLVVLRIFLTHFMQLSRSVAAVSRFYPQVKRHFTFAEQISAKNAEPPPPAMFPCLLALQPLHTHARIAQPKVDAGTHLAFLTEGNLTRKSLASLGEALAPPEGSTGTTAHLRLVHPVQPVAGHLDVSILGCAPGSDIGEIRRELAQLLAPETRSLLDERPPTEGGMPDQVPELSPTDALSLGFIAALTWRPHGIVVQKDNWEAIPWHVRRLLIKRAHQTILVIASNYASPPDLSNVDITILASSEMVVGWCPPDDLSVALQAFRTRDRPSATKPSGMQGASQETDDEEEDE